LNVTYHKPLPAPDPESQPFWDGCARHELLLPRCTDCGSYRFPPTTFCPECRSAETEWKESGGLGKVFSWIVVRHPVPRDVYADDVPYVVAIVELEEGVRMVANIKCDNVDAVAADMPVQIGFADVKEGMSLPFFRPRRHD
jgi:uncharacterized OB-fold protein